MMARLCLLLTVRAVIMMAAAAATGMPSPHFYSSSFASSLWNATQQHLSQRNNLQNHDFRLRDPHPLEEAAASTTSEEDPSSPPPRPQEEETEILSTMTVPPINTVTRRPPTRVCVDTAPPEAALYCGTDISYRPAASVASTPPPRPAVPAQSQAAPEDPDATAVLKDYILRLERRLTNIEEQNQQIISYSYHHYYDDHRHRHLTRNFVSLKPLVSATVEGLRLLVSTALPMVAWGALLGVSSVLLFHALVSCLELFQPLLDMLVRKTSIAAMIVVRFWVLLFSNKSNTTLSASPTKLSSTSSSSSTSPSLRKEALPRPSKS